MVQRVSTVAFEGIEARAVDVQVQVVPGRAAAATPSSRATPATAAASSVAPGTINRAFPVR